MKKITQDELNEFLHEIGVIKADNLFIHSSFSNIGVLKGASVKELPEAFYNAVQSYLGPEGGIFMPNYAYSFPKDRKSDLRTQSTQSGTWPEWLRQQSFSHLSGHPMFSIVGAGHTAPEICRPAEAEFSAFSENSTFARLYEKDAMIIFLGLDLWCATFMVFCEYKLGVPYRFLKPFQGTCILKNGQAKTGEFYHYCYPMEVTATPDFQDFQQRLVNKGMIKFLPLGMGKAFGIRMKPFFAEVQKYVEQNKWGLLSKEPEFYCRFENGEEVKYPIT